MPAPKQAPPQPSKPPLMLPPKPSSQTPMPQRPVKTFQIGTMSGETHGEKICVYGKSGRGKSTLGRTAPNPFFIDLDGGCRKIYHPLTGKPAPIVDGITTFDDMRDALHQTDLFPSGKPCEVTVVIDNWTVAERLAEEWVFANRKLKDGRATNLRDYGWGEGYFHLQDAMRLLLQDLEPHVRAGRNVIILAQERVANIATSAGNEYLEAGPAAFHGKAGGGFVSNREDVMQWCDHVFRIDLRDALNPTTVVDSKGKVKAGKISANTSDIRAIFTGGAVHYAAKSRLVKWNRKEPYRIPLGIPFVSPADTSLWQYIFEGAEAEAAE
jgi:hypothetical protein